MPKTWADTSLFGSSHFSDQRILQQISDRKFQTELKYHCWPDLCTRGPDFSLIGKKLLSLEDPQFGQGLGPFIQEALDEQPLAPSLMRHLKTNWADVAAAITEISESYLCRSLPKAKPPAAASAAEGGLEAPSASPPSFVPISKEDDVSALALVGEKGHHYRVKKFLAEGSAGLVYEAERVDAPGSEGGGGAGGGFGSVVASLMKKKAEGPGEGEGVEDEEEGGESDEESEVDEDERQEAQARKTHSRFAKLVKKQLGRQLVLKRVKETQKDSAENEYRIASEVGDQEEGKRFCVGYLDRILETPTRLWLVLRRVNPSEHGVDLTDFINSKFFQQIGASGPRGQRHACGIVCQLLLGLHWVSSPPRLVSMRDVKPDNVLVEYDDFQDAFEAKWTDFGLAIKFDALRTPSTDQTGDALRSALVAFWYDTQKQVPKPKWVNRTPPERTYRQPASAEGGAPSPKKGDAAGDGGAGEGACENKMAAPSSYDMYMLGVICCSIATGIDWPHIDKAKIREKALELFGHGTLVSACGEGSSVRDESDPKFLASFELGAALHDGTAGVVFRKSFEDTFGKDFGSKLFALTKQMLDEDPEARPLPMDAYNTLGFRSYKNLD
uniref:Protein kinase domain-containing protein n=1 Tax=Chromera velia CCMP2878 TaxID=1169474 RepID=A0A0G4IAF5_9ALVE|eukprot:Cvel_12473.t1-p1 / transcript=Cvel_12473.t1 / gene=Cvel_12473 / organism=Chromera_velia_CCMP2878 / gene_product=hypothetical protein / transcript_product=hypothetical protein / location=Cvel_scaffold818:5568-8231(+) / protein_length=611 / sequence_SO=supercontig / SO=protein_coding / is_pseudo=false